MLWVCALELCHVDESFLTHCDGVTNLAVTVALLSAELLLGYSVIYFHEDLGSLFGFGASVDSHNCCDYVFLHRRNDSFKLCVPFERHCLTCGFDYDVFYSDIVSCVTAHTHGHF